MSVSRKKIGRWQGAGLLATTLLGTGVFILPQMTVSIANNYAVLSWTLLTIAIIPVTLVFARLSSLYPHAGGPAYFVERAFGQIAGRSIGILFLLIVPLGVPAAILMTLQFADAIIPINGHAILLSEVVMLVLLYLLNYRGIQLSAKLQFLLTLTIVSIVAFLVSSAGFQSTNSINIAQVKSNELSLIMAAAGIGFWSFLGVEAMTHLAEEFENPKKDMIPAMLIGTSIVGLVYLACTALVIIVPVGDNLAMVGIFNRLLGGNGAFIIGVLGIAGGLSSANVYTASTVRLIASFSNDGVLPRYLAKRNKYNVPTNALATLLITMSFTLVITYFTGKDLEHLIAWVNGVFVIIYFATMMAAVKLLKNNLLLVILGCGFCFALAWGLGWKMICAFVLLALTVPFLHWQQSIKSGKQPNTA